MNCKEKEKNKEGGIICRLTLTLGFCGILARMPFFSVGPFLVYCRLQASIYLWYSVCLLSSSANSAKEGSQSQATGLATLKATSDPSLAALKESVPSLPGLVAYDENGSSSADSDA